MGESVSVVLHNVLPERRVSSMYGCNRVHTHFDRIAPARGSKHTPTADPLAVHTLITGAGVNPFPSTLVLSAFSQLASTPA